MGSNQYWAGRVYDLCVYYMPGTPEGSTESGFMEKPAFPWVIILIAQGKDKPQNRQKKGKEIKAI